ncbi:uncharacterized protein VP01_592g8 [Puccinia sorghi]|uniref:Uncharacterized protein n=1 Tax=Puccinia sorghi TaxID=27349 RepID=A0A0L6UIH0_9BASI|nr:uncharacterized protein VP01_592g8 [Puccinia sorghi]
MINNSSQSQYFLADSAFSVSVNTIPAFKNAKNKVLTDKHHVFNRHHHE